MSNFHDLNRFHSKECLITPNLRMARSYLNQYAAQIRHKGTWETPSIMAFQTAMARLWQTLPNPKVRLTRAQAQTLWLHIIEQGTQDNPLLNLKQTLTNVEQAWSRLQGWQVPLSNLAQSGALNEDVVCFLRWAKRFAQTCHEHDWITPDEIANELSHQLTNLPTPFQRIHLIGFDEWIPAQKALLTTLKHLGAELIEHDAPPAKAKIVQHALADTQTEMLSMAAWASDALKSGAKRIACVVPDLQTQRPTLIRAFTHELGDPNTFNISGGDPLAHVPIITCALNVLSLTTRSNPITLISHCCRSPFLKGAQSELDLRAVLDAKLRDLEQKHITFPTLAHHSKEAPLFHEHLMAWKTTQDNRSRTARPSEWCQQFTTQLNALGWPGNRAISSEEYQAIEQFHNVLDEFAKCDLTQPTFTGEQALWALKNHCAQTIFQIQTQDAPIQILGTLEAAGSPFDKMWVMGLNDKQWPASANPNPFLPYALQTDLQMPHADPARELQFSQNIMSRFASCTDELIYSYPCWEGDQPLSASPLIKHFPAFAPANLTPKPSLADHLFASHTTLEQIDDRYGPSLPPHEEQTHSGGTNILKHQSDCPFKAFATFRLKANSLATPQLGITPLLHGILLHDTLQTLWDTLGSQTNLLAMSSDALSDLIDTHVEQTMKKYAKTPALRSSEALRSMESQKLSHLIHRFLELEKARPDFEVLETEAEKSLKVGPLTLNMRLDRIDRDCFGNTILMDYKTGIVSPNAWFESRSSDPQLPLYAISSDEFTAMTFAQIRINKVRMTGTCAQECDIVGIKPIKKFRSEITWEMQKELWQNNLSQIAHEYAQGFAAVQPNKTNTCTTCEYHALCRILEHDTV